MCSVLAHVRGRSRLVKRVPTVMQQHNIVPYLPQICDKTLQRSHSFGDSRACTRGRTCESRLVHACAAGLGIGRPVEINHEIVIRAKLKQGKSTHIGHRKPDQNDTVTIRRQSPPDYLQLIGQTSCQPIAGGYHSKTQWRALDWHTVARCAREIAGHRSDGIRSRDCEVMRYYVMGGESERYGVKCQALNFMQQG